MSNYPSIYKSEEGYQALRDWYDNLLSKIDCEIESSFVETRFGSTHIISAGDKSLPPLILVPGLTGSAPLWYRQFPALSKHFRLLALDIPGQPGRSAPSILSLLGDDYPSWLSDVLDSLDLTTAHFAGQSAGAWMILSLAIKEPNKVDKFVMVSPSRIVGMRLPLTVGKNSVKYRNKDENELERNITAKSISHRRHGQTTDQQVARLMSLATKHFKLGKSLGIYKKGDRPSFLEGWRIFKFFLTSEKDATLKACSTPSLTLLGEQEMFYSAEKAKRRTLESLPHSKVEILPGAGHGVLYDQADLSNQLIIDFLSADPS